MKRTSALFLMLLLALFPPLGGMAEDESTLLPRGVFSLGMAKKDAEAILALQYGAGQIAESEWEGLEGRSVFAAMDYGGGILLLFDGEGPEAALAEIVTVIRDVGAASEAFADPDAYSRAEPAPNASDPRRDYELIETALTAEYGLAFPGERSASILINAFIEAQAQRVELLSRRQAADAYGAVVIDHLLLSDPMYSGLSVNTICCVRFHEPTDENPEPSDGLTAGEGL